MRTPLTVLAVSVAAAVLAAGTAQQVAAETAAPQTVHACIDSVPDPGSTAPVAICYSLHRPAGAAAESPVPVVMHGHAWGGSRSRHASSFRAWLDQGFGVLSFDQRGFGESGGLAQGQNPDVEGRDVVALVDVIASQDWVAKEDGADPVLGAVGGSYGGAYQLNGAMTEIRDGGSTRFDALVPEVTWHDMPSAFAPARVPRSAWLAVLQATAPQDMAPELSSGLAYASSTGSWPGAGAPVADLDEFLARSGPSWHVREGRRLDIPVLLRQGVTDTLVDLEQGFLTYERLLTPEARTRSLFVGYNGGHVLTSTVPLGTDTMSDPCARSLGGGYFAELAQRFLTEALKGEATGLSGHGDYHLATGHVECARVASVEPTTEVRAGLPASTATGGPRLLELARGPVRLAGRVSMDALVTSFGVDNRAFVGLSVGTSSADAKVVANQLVPLRVESPVMAQRRTTELAPIAVDVPRGKTLFLVVSPVSETFASSGRSGTVLLEDVRVRLPVVP